MDDTDIMHKLAFANVIAMLALAACDSGTSPTPSPMPTAAPNHLPAFTSAATVTVAENVTGAIYTATATDADNDPISFSISGGADAALFQINGAALSFRRAPDFDAPADDDKDNIYKIQLTAKDGAGSSTIDLTITVTDLTAGDTLTARLLSSGLTQPRDVIKMPGTSDTLLVVDYAGQVRTISRANGAVAATPLFDVTGEQSLVTGFAFSPDFAQDRTVYISVQKPVTAAIDPNSLELRRYQLTADLSRVDLSSYSRILLVPARPPRTDSVPGYQVPPMDTNVEGRLAFGPDGYLYANYTLKDDPDFNEATGTVQRIDPKGDDFPSDPFRNFRIPAGNPFANTACRPEVWAFGFNPASMAFDPATGFLWVTSLYKSDPYSTVTSSYRIEAFVIRPSQAGINFGQWGTACAAPNGHYTASMALDRRAVAFAVGGVVYRGPNEAFQGLYLFARSGNYRVTPIGDFFDPPKLYVTPTGGMKQGEITELTSVLPVTAADVLLTNISQDAEGNIYLTYNDGKIYIVS